MQVPVSPMFQHLRSLCAQVAYKVETCLGKMGLRQTIYIHVRGDDGGKSRRFTVLDLRG